jgi:hypothetical protein
VECFLTFLVLTAILTAVASLGSRARGRSRRLNPLCRRLAQQRNGAFISGGWFGQRRVRFRHRSARVLLRPYAGGGADHAQIEIDWPDPRFRLEIAPRRNGPPAGASRGLQEIETGSERFDRKYVVHGDEAEDVRAFLSNGVQWQIERLHYLLGAADLRVMADRGRLNVRKEGPLRSFDELQDFTDLSLDLYDQAMLTRAVGIEFLDEDSAQLVSQAICQVCGEDIGDDMVVCRRCKTPHHLDCWQYSGGCSVYGCRGTRSIMPAAPRPAVRAAEPRQQTRP